MLCTECGSPLSPAPDLRFCPRCGAPVANGAVPNASMPSAGPGAAYGAGPGGVPYPPVMYAAQPRVQRNLRTLAILWAAYGVYRVFAGIIGVFLFRAFTWRQWSGNGWPFNSGPMMPFGSGWLAALVPVIITISLVALTLALFTSWSLFNRKPWGRILAIVAGVLTLFKFPIGTALGIYTLWVLAPASSGAEYDAIADRT